MVQVLTLSPRLPGVLKNVAILVVTVTVASIAQGAARSAIGSRSTATALEVGILVELNDVRAAHGLRPLKLSSALTAAARQHTFEMLADGYFEHESVGGTPFEQRIRRFYGPLGGARWLVGENLLSSSPGIAAKRALALWMVSPRHRANILTADWREIGIAAVHADSAGSEYGGLPITVITTDFGAR